MIYYRMYTCINLLCDIPPIGAIFMYQWHEVSYSQYKKWAHPNDGYDLVGKGRVQTHPTV